MIGFRGQGRETLEKTEMSSKTAHDGAGAPVSGVAASAQPMGPLKRQRSACGATASGNGVNGDRFASKYPLLRSML